MKTLLALLCAATIFGGGAHLDTPPAPGGEASVPASTSTAPGATPGTSGTTPTDIQLPSDGDVGMLPTSRPTTPPRTQPHHDSGEVDHEFAIGWFKTNGPALLRSWASTVFPSMSSEEQRKLTLGVPVLVAVISGQGIDPVKIFSKGNRYAAPIFGGDKAVGYIIAVVKESGLTHERVVKDGAVGKALIHSDNQLIYDNDLQTWYQLDKQAVVSPLSHGPQQILAGGVPLVDFIKARAKILAARSEHLPQPPNDGTPDGRHVTLVAGGATVVLLLVAGVLVWLRREPEDPVNDSFFTDDGPSKLLRSLRSVTVIRQPRGTTTSGTAGTTTTGGVDVHPPTSPRNTTESAEQ